MRQSQIQASVTTTEVSNLDDDDDDDDEPEPDDATSLVENNIKVEENIVNEFLGVCLGNKAEKSADQQLLYEVRDRLLLSISHAFHIESFF
jgi:hypothetical protein